MSFAEGYVEVAERLTQFFVKYPDGSIQADPAHVVTVGDKTYIAVEAAAYRTPDDPRPARGQAWELYPGKTPYTRDSEAMNAETSAVGRALAFLGFETKKSVASADEVRARKPAPSKPAAPSGGEGEKTARQKLTARLQIAYKEAGIADRDERLSHAAFTVGRDLTSANDLTDDEMRTVIDALTGKQAAT